MLFWWVFGMWSTLQLLLSHSKTPNDTAFSNKLLLLARRLIICYGSISIEYTSLKLTISALWHLDQFPKVNSACKSSKLLNNQSHVPVPPPHAGIIVGAYNEKTTLPGQRIKQTVILNWNLWDGQVSSPSLVQFIQYQQCGDNHKSRCMCRVLVSYTGIQNIVTALYQAKNKLLSLPNILVSHVG